MKGDKQSASRGPYATPADFKRIFSEDLNSLYLLSLLLTASSDKAKECFVGGIEEAIKGNYVFKEWARSWARRTIVQSAIRLIAPLHYTRPECRKIDVARDLDKVPVILHAEVRAILDLAPPERFGFRVVGSRTLFGKRLLTSPRMRTKRCGHIPNASDAATGHLLELSISG